MQEDSQGSPRGNLRGLEVGEGQGCCQLPGNREGCGNRPPITNSMYRLKKMSLLALPAPSTLLSLFVYVCVLCADMFLHMCRGMGVHALMCLCVWKSEVNVKYLP